MRIVRKFSCASSRAATELTNAFLWNRRSPPGRCTRDLGARFISERAAAGAIGERRLVRTFGARAASCWRRSAASLLPYCSSLTSVVEAAPALSAVQVGMRLGRANANQARRQFRPAACRHGCSPHSFFRPSREIPSWRFFAASSSRGNRVMPILLVGRHAGSRAILPLRGATRTWIFCIPSAKSG